MLKKLFLPVLFATLWLLLSIYIAIPWINDVADVLSMPGAIIIISGIAFVPGFISAFVVGTLLVSKKHKKVTEDSSQDEEISLLVACRNEQENIYKTVESIAKSVYSKRINVFVIDNNSTDNTTAEAMRAKADFSSDLLDITVLFEEQKGKHNALNTALKLVKTKYVATIDGDTMLDKYALRNIVSKMKESDYGAVAGWIIEKNNMENFITKMQTYDYIISIGCVKKVQSVYDSTLVAQGAFSLYDTELVRKVGGWPDTIGEDIVLTWNLLKEEVKTTFCENAIAYTNVPEEYKILSKQRARWARGMIEALRLHNPLGFKNPATKVLTGVNFIMPYIDFSYVFFMIPSIVLALFGYHLLAGLLTILLLPLALIQISVMYFKLPKDFDKELSFIGFLGFIFLYQFMMSTMSLKGYFQEFTRKDRDWK